MSKLGVLLSCLASATLTFYLVDQKISMWYFLSIPVLIILIIMVFYKKPLFTIRFKSELPDNKLFSLKEAYKNITNDSCMYYAYFDNKKDELFFLHLSKERELELEKNYIKKNGKIVKITHTID